MLSNKTLFVVVVMLSDLHSFRNQRKTHDYTNTQIHDLDLHKNIPPHISMSFDFI